MSWWRWLRTTGWGELRTTKGATFVLGRELISERCAFPRSLCKSFEANLRPEPPGLGRVGPRSLIDVFDLRRICAPSKACAPASRRGRSFHSLARQPFGFFQRWHVRLHLMECHKLAVVPSV